MHLIVDVKDAKKYRNPLPRFRPRRYSNIDYFLGLVPDHEDEE